MRITCGIGHTCRVTDQHDPTDGPRPGVVVAAAVVRAGCVLAARRRDWPGAVDDRSPSVPDDMIGRAMGGHGGWELPGGKVEAGETDAAAVARECREELGIDVEVVDRLGVDVPLGPGSVLRGYVARMVAGSPQPVAGADHDALRWLGPEELDDVCWLDPDRPLIAALREPLLDGEPLTGGGVGGAVRIGETVRRPTGHWTPTVHRLLEHLRAHDVPGVPRPLGRDARGREIVSYLPGETLASMSQASSGEPFGWVPDSLLVQLGRWLRRFHEASRSFRTPEPVWRLAAGELRTGEVVCHNDVAPRNVVVKRRPDTGELELVGVLDWDVAGPGRAIDDLAFAAWSFVLLTDLARSAVADAARRLGVLAQAYGGISPRDVLEAVPARLELSMERIRSGAERGDAGMARLRASGVVEKVEQARARLLEIAPAIARALTSK